MLPPIFEIIFLTEIGRKPVKHHRHNPTLSSFCLHHRANLCGHVSSKSETELIWIGRGLSVCVVGRKLDTLTQARGTLKEQNTSFWMYYYAEKKEEEQQITAGVCVFFASEVGIPRSCHGVGQCVPRHASWYWTVTLFKALTHTQYQAQTMITLTLTLERGIRPGTLYGGRGNRPI